MPQLLLIGGRSGVGKTSVAFELSRQLATSNVSHCVIDGDSLAHAVPLPDTDPLGTNLTETNLGLMWQTYARLGYVRCIYVNTVSVLEPDMITRAIGQTSSIVSVLLTATDSTVLARLTSREAGSGLAAHIERSATAAELLESDAPDSVVRVATDDASVESLAHVVVDLTGWLTVQ